jgi:hypothetical protein
LVGYRLDRRLGGRVAGNGTQEIVPTQPPQRTCLRAAHRGRTRGIEQQGDLAEVITVLQRPCVFAVNGGVEDTRPDEKHVVSGLTLPDNDFIFGGLLVDEGIGELVRGRNRQWSKGVHPSDGVNFFPIRRGLLFDLRQATQAVDRAEYRHAGGHLQRCAHSDSIVEHPSAQVRHGLDREGDQYVDSDE